MIGNDNITELEVVHSYNDGIKHSLEVDDQGTVDLLTTILKNGRRPCRLGRNLTCTN